MSPIAHRPSPSSPGDRAAHAAPIVKWAGGKTRLLAALTRHCPATYRRYYEPFVGGGALFFRLHPAGAVLADLNADLMDMYRTVADDVEAVIQRLRVHAARHGHAHYYATRSRFNARATGDGRADRAAMVLYLNKTCYNGLWRVNAAGAFNVPMGRYRNPRVVDTAALRAAAARLRQAQLRCGDYETTLQDAGPEDLIYLDPPYAPLSKTANFASYTVHRFGAAEQQRLAAVARKLVARGCTVVLSNHDTPAIRALYSDFAVTELEHARAINSDPARRGAVRELIVRAPAGVAGPRRGPC